VENFFLNRQAIRGGYQRISYQRRGKPEDLLRPPRYEGGVEEKGWGHIKEWPGEAELVKNEPGNKAKKVNLS